MGRGFSVAIGQRFGRLTVETLIGVTPRQARVWSCRCDCGAAIETTSSKLTGGRKLSCGCLAREAASNLLRTHGLARTPEYKIWKGIKNRCYNPNAIGWKTYGGAGVTMCEGWRHSFPAFLADVGLRPSAKHSIDRINAFGNYEPSNVRWATIDVQSNNRPRQNVYIEYNGRTQTLAQWARELGVGASALRQRLTKGWPTQRAFTEPYYPGPHT